MVTYACILLLFTFTTTVALEHCKFKPENNKILNYVSLENNRRTNVLRIWELFSKIIVLKNGTSEQCRQDSQLYLHSLDHLELWALKMFDATAKPPPGILSGNGNQYGDFDECLSVEGIVKGKYCLASLQVNLDVYENMKVIDYLVHSGHVIRSNLTDVGHHIPLYSSLLWGICIPNSCTNLDLEKELTQRLSHLGVSVRVKDTMCSVKDNKIPYSIVKTFAIIFFLAQILLLSLGTYADKGGEEAKNFKKFLNAFSLKRNLRKLFDLSDDTAKIKGLDACRGINSLMLVIFHKILAIINNPFVNKNNLATLFNTPLSVVFRSSMIYVDSFLYMSGFLNTHSILQELERKGTISVKNRFIARWFRLYPLYLSTILFCGYILPDLNNGPQWNLAVGDENRNCEKNMWKNLLFIHNYCPLEDMCLPHTHQISTDMQFYIVTIPLVVLIWKKRTLGSALLFILVLTSVLLKFLATYWYDISMFLYTEISLKRLMAAARYSYLLPTHRATSYFIGVFMAYLIEYKKLKFTLSDHQSIMLWVFCFGLATVTLLSPYRMLLRGYQYEHFPAAMYAAFTPLMWGLFLSVALWAICNDYAGVVTPLVESRVFKFYSKIAYSVYLTHIPIFFYNVGVRRNAEYFSIFSILDMPEFMTIIVISIITTVTIEMPFIAVYKTYFGQTQKKQKVK